MITTKVTTSQCLEVCSLFRHQLIEWLFKKDWLSQRLLEIFRSQFTKHVMYRLQVLKSLLTGHYSHLTWIPQWWLITGRVGEEAAGWLLTDVVLQILREIA